MSESYEKQAAGLTRIGLLDRLRAECAAAGNQTAWAKRHGFAPAFVTNVLLGVRQPSARMVRSLGYERIVIYRARDLPLDGC